MSDYFYTLPPKPVAGYEYNKQVNLGAVGYFVLATENNMPSVPGHSEPLVNQLISADSGDVILEYDLDQLINLTLPSPAIFKTLISPATFDRNLELMWQISGLDPCPLPVLPAGTRYRHIGAFVNRPGAGLRLNVTGGSHYVRQFVVDHGGDPHWFDCVEHHHVSHMASCDLVDGQVTNLRVEIHRRYDGFQVPELLNDAWVQSALAHCNENIQKNYSNNLPKVIISHYKLGANTQDIANNYMKMYTQAEWAGTAKYTQ